MKKTGNIPLFAIPMECSLSMLMMETYELVYARKPELERCQQIFQGYPELEVLKTGDIWVEYKSKPGA